MSVSENVKQKYVDVISKAPPVGTILRTTDDSYSLLRVELEEDKPPFIYGRAYPIETIGDKLGWYLRGADDTRNTGYKCILLSAARRAIIKAFPQEFQYGQIPVKSLRVVRVSNTGQSLLCEVHKYAVDEVTLKDLMPIGSEFTKAEALQRLRKGKWMITEDLMFCLDPNGNKVNIIG